MNITIQNTDELNATLKIQLNKDDYEERVTKVLKDYRRKANIPGFRPGNVPISYINKMYYKPVLAEEINKLVSEKITEYLKTEKIQVLGDPLPNETENKPFDWDNDKDFEFIFDLGIAPTFEININKKNKIKFYEIELEESMIENYINTYTKRYGRYKETDIIDENEMVKGDLVQVDSEGKILENPFSVTDASIYLELSKDENEKKAFKGAKAGDIVKFDLKKAFPDDREITNILKTSADKIVNLGPLFQFTIKSILKFEKAEIDQELFNKIYGENKVNSMEEFRNKITAEITESLKRESDYKFQIDAREFILKQLKLELPVAFLKKWIKAVNTNKFTDEQIEKEFSGFEENMKWQLIKNKILKDNNIEVPEDSVIEYAKEITRNQFSMYGINNVPDEQIDTYAVSLLKKEDEVHNIVEKLREDKAIEFIKEQVTLENKQVKKEEFSKLFT